MKYKNWEIVEGKGNHIYIKCDDENIILHPEDLCDNNGLGFYGYEHLKNMAIAIMNYDKEKKDNVVKNEKDPNDYKNCSLSTNWEIEEHYCTNCKKTTTHNEFMSDICCGCGSFKTQKLYGRTYRKIYIDGKWKYQIKYKKKGNMEIIEEWY